MKAYIYLNIFVVCLLAFIFFVPSTDNARPADLVMIAGDDLHNLDPQRTSWMVDFRVLECLYETLVDFDVHSRTLKGAGAESWTVSEDGRTYTFHLRADARWSNGDPVVAKDYKYGWMRALLPDFAADYVTMLFNIRGAEDFYKWRQQAMTDYAKSGADKKTQETADALWQETRRRFDEMVAIETPDPLTLVVHLTRPVPYFLELTAFMTFSPVHEESIAPFILGPYPATGGVEQDPRYFLPDHHVSNGPYVLKRRRPKWDILLHANEQYWNRSAMKNSSVLIRIIDEPQTAKRRYLNGDADWWPDAPTNEQMTADLVKQDLPDLHVYTVIGTYFLNFNCLPTLTLGEKNPFADVRVRRAFSMAIDRERIVEVVTGAGQPVATCFVPEGMFEGYVSPVEASVKYDPPKARELLAEAGYPNGEGLPVLRLLFNDSTSHGPIMEFIANTWRRELNAPIEFDRKTPTVFGQMRAQQNFAIARGGWYGDYNDPTTFLTMFRSDDGNNSSKWANKKYDKLLEKADATLDPQERLKMLAEAERLLLEEQPLTPIFYYIQLEMYDEDRVKGLFADPLKRYRIDQIEVLTD